jgi:hypothetical protein
MKPNISEGNRARRGHVRMLGPCAALAASLVAATGCDDVFSLKQENPSQLTADAVYTPANARLMVNGAIADFECAYTRFVVASALLGDEMANVISGSNNYEYDQRTLRPVSPYAGGCGTGLQSPGFYTALSTARGVADKAYAQLDDWTDEQVPDRTMLMGQVAVYAGYSIVLLGESMCSAAIDVGPELTPADLYDEALSRFDDAIAAATSANDATTLNLAKVGKARALLDRGNAAAAATEVAAIPANFVVNISTDATYARRQNVVYLHLNQNNWSTVDSSYLDLTLGGGPDARVRVSSTTRKGTARNTPIFTADKYPAVTTPIPVAKYAEAQLIIAEANAAAGDVTGAAAAINAARNSSGRTGMPQYDATGQSAAQVRTQLIEERRREFFLEGHRFNDVRRFDLPLVPAPGAPFRSAAGTYGDQRCFPLPDVERNNNPNIPKTQ